METKKTPTAKDILDGIPADKQTAEQEKQVNDQNTANENTPAEEQVKAEQNTAPETETTADTGAAEWQKKADEYADLLKRKLAEFDNYKRRTEQEKLELLDMGAVKFINQVLPVVDDLDRTIAHLATTSDVEVLKKGVLAVYDKLQKVLSNNKITRLASVGTPFDVNLHEAMLYQPSAEFPPDTVINEFIPAYQYKERVIRHAQVVVSDESSGSAQNPPAETPQA